MKLKRYGCAEFSTNENKMAFVLDNSYDFFISNIEKEFGEIITEEYFEILLNFVLRFFLRINNLSIETATELLYAFCIQLKKAFHLYNKEIPHSNN